MNDLYWIKDNASRIMIHDYTGEQPQDGHTNPVTGMPPATPSGRV